MSKEVEFNRKVLDNGVTVIHEKRNIPVVAVASSVKYGAQYESADMKGISHFMEHLVFKGTKKRKVDEISREVESKGGIINAFTGEEITCFWNKMPSKHFSLASDITRDLIVNPLFESESLERERKVILEEIKMYNDNPSTFVLEKIKEKLYKGSFSMSIAGTIKTVSSLSRKKIIDLHNSVYTSNNIIFSVVGGVNWEDVLMEAKKFPKKSNIIKDLNIIKNNGTKIYKRKGIDQANEVIGFHMPKLNDQNRYAAEIFDGVLGGGMSSRLFQEIREKRGLCYAIKSNLEQSKNYAYEFIYVGTTKDKIKEVKELVLIEIKKLSRLNQSDLNEAKERLIGLRKINKERSDSTMFDLLQEEIGRDANNYYNYEDNISKVKLNDVRLLSKLKGYSFVALVPEG
ncbi:MAG: pitrilysin family protein [Nanoarchaeota archaeon]